MKLTLLASSLLLLSPFLPKMAKDIESLNIESSTVYQDLEAFYGEKYGERIFQNLIPSKKKGDEYSDFKFLNMYASNGDLYLYFYAQTSFDVNYVYFEYSDSMEQNEDGSMKEHYHVLNDYASPAPRASIASEYGVSKVFYKCKIEDFYDENEGDAHRVLASTLILYDEYQELFFVRKCDEHEYSWVDGEQGEDQVYSYYKDNYIIVDAASYYQQWVVTAYESSNQNFPIELQEINWLFFDYSFSSLGEDYEFGALKSVIIDYVYRDFYVNYSLNGRMGNYSPYGPVYFGTYEHPEVFLDNLPARGARIEASEMTSHLGQLTVTPSRKKLSRVTDTPSSPLFFWQNAHAMTYDYNTIQRLDDDSISKVTDENYRDFLLNNRSDYRYAIDMRDDRRWITDYGYQGSRWTITSHCHEFSSAVITRLTFETEYGEVDLNAIMDPVTLNGIETTTGYNYEVISETKATAQRVLKGILIALGVVAGITLIAFLVITLLRYAGVLDKRKKGKRK